MQPFQRRRHQREHRERKIKSIAESVWIYHGMPSDRDSCNWQEAEEIYKHELNSTPSPVFTLALLGIALAAPYPWLALPRPIQVNYEISWVILALISSITLSYVSMLNELQDKYTNPALVFRRPRIRRITTAMSWALLLMFLCIFCLLIRIALTSYIPLSNPAPAGLTLRLITKLDYLILWSFLWSSLLRIVIFLLSYWKFFLSP